MKGNNKVLALMLIALVLIVSGVTYAAFTSNRESGLNTITTGQISMSYTEASNALELSNAIPVSDTEGLGQSKYFEFSVTSHAKTDADDNIGVNVPYEINVTPLSVTSGYTQLGTSQVKVGLTTDLEESLTVSTIDKLVDSTLRQGAKKVYTKTNTFKNGAESLTEKYKLRMWINDEVEQTDINQADYEYRLRVNVDSNINIKDGTVIQNPGDPNAPDLGDNMIPVYYDEADGVWRKADRANANNSWYDYNSKKWANAVTVYDSLSYIEMPPITKTVSIDNPLIKFYVSGNAWKNNSESTATFTFTTGNIGGTYSFDYSVSSGGDDYLKVIINDIEVIYESGIRYSTYKGVAEANTTYTITATYKKSGRYSINDDEATISNFILPEGSSEVVMTSSSDYPWSISDRYKNKFYPIYEFYDYSGEYYLYDLNAASYSLARQTTIVEEDMYICSDLVSTSCNTMYKVLEMDNDTITKIEVYEIDLLPSERQSYISSPVGTIIPMSDINTMMVWIPRYSYEVFNYNENGDSYSNPQEINIKFEIGTNESSEILCADNIHGESGTGLSEVCKTNGTVCTDATCNGLMYTHPAFCFGDKNADGTCPEDAKLTGLWVSKFEFELNSKPNNQTYGETSIASFSSDIMKMNDNNNYYGFTENEDTHMIKNMEWGAIAYLSHSKYGTCTNGVCKDVKANYFEVDDYSCEPDDCYYDEEEGYVCGEICSGDSYLVTGCGPSSSTSTLTTTTCNVYNSNLGVLASTTQNVYGVYDMAGGANEYVMGNVVDKDGITMIPSYSNFTVNSYPTSKYYSKYSYGTTNNDVLADKRSKLGDAIKEVAFNAEYNWYEDLGNVADLSNPWFIRGGSANSESLAGIFSVNGHSGSGAFRYSTRFVLTR